MCSPFKSAKNVKSNELEDLKYYLDNALSRTDDILLKHRSLVNGSDVKNFVQRRRSSERLNPSSTYDSLYANLSELQNHLNNCYEMYEKTRLERDDLAKDYDLLSQEKDELLEKYEEIESEAINLRHNNLVLDYQKNPLKKDKIEELEDNYVDLYGTYKRTIRESKEKMEMMKVQYERSSMEQKEKIEYLKAHLQQMKEIQKEFGDEVKQMSAEFKEKEDIMAKVIEKLQEENKKLREELENVNK